MNDTRLRGMAVAGSEAAGRKSPHNHAQIARNLKRSLRNAAAGARLIQAEGLDSESVADVAASLADALEELDRLQRASTDEFDATRDACGAWSLGVGHKSGCSPRVIAPRCRPKPDFEITSGSGWASASAKMSPCRTPASS